MSSSREEHRRPPALDKGTTAPRPEVKPTETEQRVEPSPARGAGTSDAGVWQRIWARENVLRALQRVERNQGAPGSDGMRVEELRPYLRTHWPGLREALESGRYEPQPVRRVEMPKPEGGVRLLGIPTALDRFLQQAIHQALTPMFEAGFSGASYGFRPGRSAHDAVRQAQAYVGEGYEWVVDLDLDKFFDRVNHDMLMARVARVVQDKRVLKLIRAYLEAGVMINGVVEETEEGTPQGGPLSPLLANILLDDLDKELEKRGHKFVRYADDCNIYVKTVRAGERVMASVQEYLEKKLRLKVNEKKSKVERAWRVKFLGFSFLKRRGMILIRVATRTVGRCRERLRRMTRRTRSGKMEEIIAAINRYVGGWIGYYRLADTPSVFQSLDEWLRRRLRQVLWKRWKRGRTRYRELVRLGVPSQRAALGAVGTSPWRMSATPVVHEALSNAYWRSAGLLSIAERYRHLRSV